ncbi:MAG: histidine--tRNA ligase [Flavobacteriaceae bacterium]|nr:histidine--tRNA ligase [Flavobacteriaceae bacterium]
MSLKPSIPKGTKDYLPDNLHKRNYLKKILRETFEIFGFLPIETPSFERNETLIGKYGEHGDRLIFKILNSGDKLKKADIKSLEKEDVIRFSNSLSEKALRYDLTVPLARFVSQHRNEISFPFRRYQMQNVWRADRPQKGRFQEFLQCDVDIVGSKSILQEVEIILMCENIFSRLNLKNISVNLNHRKILEGVAIFIGVKDKFLKLTSSLDKLDKIGMDGVINELENQEFSKRSIDLLIPFLDNKGSFKSKIDFLSRKLKDIEVAKEGLDDLFSIYSKINKFKLNCISVNLDINLARGLDYYTGLILEVVPDKGEFDFGSIAGGGRYDNLTDFFGLKDTSGFGISFGFDRINLMLEKLKLFPKDLSKSSKVMFVNFEDQITDQYLQEILKLRERGVACEIYPTKSKLKKQLDYANQRKIPFVIMIGSDELSKKEFVIKNMETGTQSVHKSINLIDEIMKLI